jgi:predicted HAD superfamily Cof-like phosphohydrolase
MQNSQKQVKEFHEKFDLMINETPTVVDEATLKLRCKLLLEEVKEFCEAAGFSIVGINMSSNAEVEEIDGAIPNLIEMADALTDIQYVNDGAALALGIDLEPIASEVHRSNMSKLWNVNEIEKLRSDTENNWQAKGDAYSGFVVKNEHGKVIKSPSYSPADIKTELNKQGANL